MRKQPLGHLLYPFYVEPQTEVTHYDYTWGCPISCSHLCLFLIILGFFGFIYIYLCVSCWSFYQIINNNSLYTGSGRGVRGPFMPQGLCLVGLLSNHPWGNLLEIVVNRQTRQEKCTVKLIFVVKIHSTFQTNFHIYTYFTNHSCTKQFQCNNYLII